MMGRLFASEEVKATKEWLQNYFDAYPQGVKKIYKRRRSDEICIRLEHPIDLDFLEDIIKERGFKSEITEDSDRTRVLNVYSTVEKDGDIITKSLHSVFREQKDIDIGTEPVKKEDSVHPRLVLICDYLRGKYN